MSEHWILGGHVQETIRTAIMNGWKPGDIMHFLEDLQYRFVMTNVVSQPTSQIDEDYDGDDSEIEEDHRSDFHTYTSFPREPGNPDPIPDLIEQAGQLLTEADCEIPDVPRPDTVADPYQDLPQRTLKEIGTGNFSEVVAEYQKPIGFDFPVPPALTDDCDNCRGRVHRASDTSDIGVFDPKNCSPRCRNNPRNLPF